MSTNNQNRIKLEDLLKPIEDLLDRLGEIDRLTKPHRSVLISFKQMLDYTDSISTSGMRPEIKLLLNIYQDMAKKFYTQYEITLLAKVREQQTRREDVDKVLLLLEKAQALSIFNRGEIKVEDALKTAEKLLNASVETAISQYEDLIKDFPTLLQRALDKLKEEWQRLNAIAVASKTLDRDRTLIQAMDAVVEAARFSIGIQVDRIAVVPGDAFSLQFYSYLKNFAVLTVPIYSVQAPWEWSIFWHELAGNKVRRLEKDTALEINRLGDDLKAFHGKYRKMVEEPPANSEQRKKLLEFIARNNQYPDSQEQYGYTDSQGQHQGWVNYFTQKYLDDFLTKEFSLRDFGGFEQQFERMLERLPSKDRFQQYETIKSFGWCVDWLKELFEDSWSVLAIRDPFPGFLKDVLNRHIANDGRHPPVDTRVQVAEEILRLMRSEEKIKYPKTIIEAAAQQILKFISLLVACSMENAFASSQDFQNPDIRPAYRPMLSDMVGNEIGKKIKIWSDRLMANSALEEGRNDEEEFIQTLGTPEMKQFIQFISDPNEQDLAKLEASYDDLLMVMDQGEQKPRGYEDLIKLPFYDVDFDVVTKHTIGIAGTSFQFMGALPIPSPSGTVFYTVDGKSQTVDGKSFQTNPDTWNQFFGNFHKVPKTG